MNDPRDPTIDVTVAAVSDLAQGVRALELRRTDGAELPAFTAGAHVDLHLANGMVRSYSLCNDPQERHRYLLGIQEDTNGKGGSRFIHARLRQGDALRISPPRNNFLLSEGAAHSAFFAGGIGITPLWCMIQRLERLGASWELHYSVRLPQMCAFMQELQQLEARDPGRVHLNFDHLPGGVQMDLGALISGLAPDTHVYCCGPTPMLKAFEAAAARHLQPQQIHLEYFTNPEQAATQGGYAVVLRRSGKRLQIQPGATILQTLLTADIDVPYSCTEGVCGMCETRVIEGIPDHRDQVLSDAEQASNKTMMVCCSGSRTPELVLDL